MKLYTPLFQGHDEDRGGPPANHGHRHRTPHVRRSGRQGHNLDEDDEQPKVITAEEAKKMADEAAAKALSDFAKTAADNKGGGAPKDTTKKGDKETKEAPATSWSLPPNAGSAVITVLKVILMIGLVLIMIGVLMNSDHIFNRSSSSAASVDVEKIRQEVLEGLKAGKDKIIQALPVDEPVQAIGIPEGPSVQQGNRRVVFNDPPRTITVGRTNNRTGQREVLGDFSPEEATRMQNQAKKWHWNKDANYFDPHGNKMPGPGR